MTKPNRPADLSNVSTWTPDQMAYAAPIIAEKAIAAASETYAQARATDHLEAKVELTKIANTYMNTGLFWQQVQLGNSPKVPVFLKSQRVQSYEQTNKRYRPAKTRYAGPKDWGIWS